MTRKIIAFALLPALFMLFGAALLGADIDGKWTGEVQTPDGNSVPITMNFKTDGDKVTGTITGPSGDVNISDGKMDGDTVSLSINVDADGQQLPFKCSGELKDDELKMNLEGGGDLSFEFVAKRSAG